MLEVIIPKAEYFDEINNEFIYTNKQVLKLEHSLVSVSKWEATWKKPFLAQDRKSLTETLDYIRCMTITQNVDPIIFTVIPPKIVNQITEYINEPMTATKFTTAMKEAQGFEIVTSEIIYYWMVSLNIPFECQKWHLNRLLTLIKVCNIKNSPPDKRMGKQEVLNRNHLLNEERKKKYQTNG